eukprot:scaffold7783_cov85-Skeletonema_dohrnii-CCMP3373.AAC.4
MDKANPTGGGVFYECEQSDDKKIDVGGKRINIGGRGDSCNKVPGKWHSVVDTCRKGDKYISANLVPCTICLWAGSWAGSAWNWITVELTRSTRGSVEKGELEPGGARAVPRTPVGPAGYGLVAVGGWQTLRRGRSVGGSGFLGWNGVGVAVEFLMGGFGGRPR